jgi:hypothetical protein
VPSEWHGLEDEVVVDSHACAHKRLEAALSSVDQAGASLMPTASTTRPTILDYNYVYEQGVWAAC